MKNNISGIILGAGDSSRFGQPKQLINYHGVPMIKYIARTALTAGLQPVVLVIGFDADRIEAEVNDLPIVISKNPHWQKGQSTSLISGLHSLPKQTDAALFFLGDQPQITVTVIMALIESYNKTKKTIIFPEINKKRSHPILFDKTTFKDLLRIIGDSGGREIFVKHPPASLQWHDERLLLDVDTPEDYENLLSGKVVSPSKTE